MRHRTLNRTLGELHRPREPKLSDRRETLEVELLAAYRSLHRPRRWMMVVNPQSRTARWALATLMIALLGIGACEVPTTYQVEMGKQLQIQTQAAAWTATPADVMRQLQSVEGVDDLSVSVSEGPDGASTLLIYAWGYDLDADALVSRLRTGFPTLAESAVDVRPLAGTVRGKLGDRLGEALFDIHVSGETADEIRAEILAQLAAQGFSGDAQIDVQTDGEFRTITIETSTDASSGQAPGETEDVEVKRQ